MLGERGHSSFHVSQWCLLFLHLLAHGKLGYLFIRTEGEVCFVNVFMECDFEILSSNYAAEYFNFVLTVVVIILGIVIILGVVVVCCQLL